MNKRERRTLERLIHIDSMHWDEALGRDAREMLSLLGIISRPGIKKEQREKGYHIIEAFLARAEKQGIISYDDLFRGASTLFTVEADKND